VGYEKRFDARGVAGKVLCCAEAKEMEVAAKARMVERATGDILTMEIIYVGREGTSGGEDGW